MLDIYVTYNIKMAANQREHIFLKGKVTQKNYIKKLLDQLFTHGIQGQ